MTKKSYRNNLFTILYFNQVKSHTEIVSSPIQSWPDHKRNDILSMIKYYFSDSRLRFHVPILFIFLFEYMMNTKNTT